MLPCYLLRNYRHFFTADEARAITVYIRALKASGSSDDRAQAFVEHVETLAESEPPETRALLAAGMTSSGAAPVNECFKTTRRRSSSIGAALLMHRGVPRSAPVSLVPLRLAPC